MTDLYEKKQYKQKTCKFKLSVLALAFRSDLLLVDHWSAVLLVDSTFAGETLRKFIRDSSKVSLLYFVCVNLNCIQHLSIWVVSLCYVSEITRYNYRTIWCQTTTTAVWYILKVWADFLSPYPKLFSFTQCFCYG